MATAVEAVVIGAGPAGLASAACLGRAGVSVTVLEAGAGVGTSWRGHYERLHLHTVKQHSGLPGLPFPAEVGRYPARAEVVAYLDAYAAHFGISPRTNEPVRRVRPINGGGFEVESQGGPTHADVVVVATGLNRVPNPDELPGRARFRGPVSHAGRYREGAAFAGQRVLVVGAGNTGAEIALDLAEHGAKPVLSIRTPVNVVPRDFLGLPMQVTAIRLGRLPIAARDRIGRIVRRLAFGNLARFGLLRPATGPISSIVERGRIPILDVGTVAAIKRGDIVVRPAVASLTETGASFVDGSELALDAVILATGYRTGLSDIVDVPGALRDDGAPKDWKGGGACPGLYFVGFASVATGLLREIGREAEALAAEVAAGRLAPAR
jgi:cation diffusion facilitator CzcD-associated flavoprotein CzcO